VWYRSNEVEDDEDVEEDDKEVEDDEDGDEENGEDIAEDEDERDDDDDETSAVSLRWTCICARTPSYLYSNNKFAPLAHANTS
jgi:hypothetical protein